MATLLTARFPWALAMAMAGGSVGAPSIRGRRVPRSVLVVALALGALGVTGEPAGAAPEPEISASVVGGKPVGLNQFPALAAILLAQPREVPARDRLLCTGTVIARRWILSAGHCSQAVLFGEPLIVQVGRPDLGDPRAVVAHVNRAVVHKNFMKNGRGFDVALFHVATDINVPMARLAVASDLPRMAAGQSATIVGWGLTKRLALQEFPGPEARPPVRARA